MSLSISLKVLWIAVMVAAGIAALVLIIGVASAGGAPQEAAAAAIAAAIAVIPYIFVRAVSEFRNNREAEVSDD